MAKTANRLDSLRNLQVANLDVAFASAFGSLISGTILIGFIQYLGGKDLWVSLAAAIPALIGLLQIPGAIWGRSFPFYRKFVAPGGWIWRLLHIPLIILPFTPLSGNVRLLIVMLCISLASAAVQIVSAIYNEWIAEMVPSNSRGWYFSRRTLISTACGAAFGLLGGFLLDYFKDREMTQMGYTIVFSLGVLCAMISMYYFLKMEEMERKNPVQTSIKEGLRQLISPAKDRNFVKVLIFTIVYAVSQGFAGNLYAAYARETLQLPFVVIQFFGVSHAITTILFVKMWGFLADKYGNKPILVLLAGGTVLAPLTWQFTQPNALVFNATLLILGHLFNGFVWSGVGVTQLNLYMSTSDPDDRANYLAATSAVSAIALFFAPLIGGWCMTVFRDMFSVEHAYKTVFWMVVGIRFCAVLTLIPVREHGAFSFRSAMKQMIRVKPSGVIALKNIQKSSDSHAREDAVETIGKTGMALGADELLKALYDPSPRVRRKAAISLGKIGSPQTGLAIVEFLEKHPDLAEEELLYALGECGSPEAVDLVTRYLDDPRSVLRRSAAKALGVLGDPKAIDALSEATNEAGDPDLRRAALQALRLLEAKEAASVFGDSLFDGHPSVRTAAAEAISELDLKELAPNLRESIDWFGDDTSAEMCYALAVVGDRSDLPRIMSIAERMINSTLRRRCLMGVARLLGVEPDFYRLINKEELGRDEEILKLLKTAVRSNKGMAGALDRYSSGDETGALHDLADAVDLPELKVMADYDIDEIFLVAALFVASK